MAQKSIARNNIYEEAKSSSFKNKILLSNNRKQ